MREDELRDDAGRRDTADDTPFQAAVRQLTEPDIAVRTGSDTEGPAAGRRNHEFRNDAGRCDSADFVTDLFGEPDASVGAGGDPGWFACGRRQCELRDDP